MYYKIKSTETLLETLDILMKIGTANAFNKNVSSYDLNIYIKIADRLMTEDD